MNGFTIGATSRIDTLSPALQAALIQLSALDPDSITSTTNLLAAIATMSLTSILLVSRASDGSSSTQEIPLTGAGTFQFAEDASGNVTLTAAPTVQPIHTNKIVLNATATVGTVITVTLPAAMPDTNYTVLFQYGTLAGSVELVEGSQTTTTYQIKVTAIIVGTIIGVAVHGEVG